MKKIFLAIAIVFMMVFGANAQYYSGGSDGLFTTWDDISNGLDRPGGDIDFPVLPGSHGGGSDIPAPLGNGLLVLTALGGFYALKRRKK